MMDPFVRRPKLRDVLAICAGSLKRLHDAVGHQWRFGEAYAERRQRVLGSSDNGGGGRDGSSFARALDANRIERRGRLDVSNGTDRDVGCHWKQIISEGRG